MTNPVNPNRADLPSINEPMVDPDTGVASNEWYRWALAILNRTGGTTGASSSDAASVAQQAYNLSVTANNNANNALTQVQGVNTSLASTTTIAEGAQASADAAIASAGACLSKTANLSDLSSFSTSRTTLGVNNVPLSFSIPSFTGQSLYVPVVTAITIPANFTCVTFCATPPSSNAVITLSVHRVSSLVQTIANITLAAGVASAIITATNIAYSIAVGDTLQLQLPTSSAANVGLTIRATLT